MLLDPRMGLVTARNAPLMILVLAFAGCAGNSAAMAERDGLRAEVQSLRRENATVSESIKVLADRMDRLATAYAARPPTERNATGSAAFVATDMPPSGEGWITLRTEPWCDVYFNGDLVGTTPLNRLVSPAGTVPLLLVCKPPGVLRELKIDVRSGEESMTRLRLDSE